MCVIFKSQLNFFVCVLLIHACSEIENLVPLFQLLFLQCSMPLTTVSIDDFWSITIVVTLLVMSPGPAFAITVDNSLHYGRKGGLQTALGIMMGDFAHILLNLLGISMIIIRFPGAMQFIQMCGALYFIYLGVQLFIKTLTNDPLKKTLLTPSTQRNPFQKGLCVGLLNPKAGIFYIHFFAVMLPISLPTVHRLALGGWILIIVLFWFTCVAMFLNYGAMRDRFLKYHPWIQRLCGLALVYCGAKILLGH